MTLGKRLLFVLCAPRSGSTLLQHILGSHSLIHTLPEPWLMLPLAYTRRHAGVATDYNARYGYLAVTEFINRLPGGEEAYIEGVRELASRLYERAIAGSGKELFLDKTPRYYHIIPELLRIFPKARFIVLLRNPMAVFASLLSTTCSGNLRGFSRRDRLADLLDAPRLLVKGLEQLGDAAMPVKYEELVLEPERVTRELCVHLGIEFEKEMINYGTRTKFEATTFVDPKAIYRHDRPVVDYMEAWTREFGTPQMKRLGNQYLAAIGGRQTVSRLGYDYDDLVTRLERARPHPGTTRFPFYGLLPIPWRLLMTPRSRQPSLQRYAVDVLCAINARGLTPKSLIRGVGNFRQIRVGERRARTTMP